MLGQQKIMVQSTTLLTTPQAISGSFLSTKEPLATPCLLPQETSPPPAADSGLLLSPESAGALFSSFHEVSLLQGPG